MSTLFRWLPLTTHIDVNENNLFSRTKRGPIEKLQCLFLIFMSLYLIFAFTPVDEFLVRLASHNSLNFCLLLPSVR